MMELKQKKIGFISLGCDKNRVDLEEMMNNLSSFGFKFDLPENSDIVLINTCAFILPARKEAIENIMEIAKLKAEGKVEKIVVTGCLPQRYLDQLEKFIPEVDKFVTLKDNKNIVQIVANLYGEEVKFKPEDKQLPLAPNHYAYLKIADGCNNACAYCTIPRIRGRYKSVPIENLVSRAKQLVNCGAKELILVAQDTTRYGYDLYDEYKLIDLLKELVKIKDIKWIRLHYLYPELVTDELLKYISETPKICPYLDIPFQHIDDKILKDMNRRNTEYEARNLIDNIHQNYPNLLIRSTFIVGFPGETKKQFNKLCDFLKEAKLDNVGFFKFSKEESTKAFYMKKQVFEFIKQRRLLKAQKVQSEIMLKNNLSQIGNVEEVLIDSFDPETGFFESRTNKMSPNVDFVVKISCSENVEIGKFYNVKLTNFENYYFFGELV